MVEKLWFSDLQAVLQRMCGNSDTSLMHLTMQGWREARGVSMSLFFYGGRGWLHPHPNRGWLHPHPNIKKKLIYHYHALQSGFKIGSRNSCGFRLRCFPSFLCSSSLDCNPDVGVVSEVYLKHVFILGSCDIVRCLPLETSASLKLVFLDSLAASGYRGTKARSRNGRGTNESKRPADMLRVLELEIPETLKGLWLRLWLNSYFGMVKAQNIHGSFHDLFHMEGQQ